MGCRIRARPSVRIGVEPPPNYERELQARWNAYFRRPDPDALKDTPEDLRGSELKDHAPGAKGWAPRQATNSGI